MAERVDETDGEGGVARWIAAGAVALAAFGVLLVLLTQSGDSYRVKGRLT